jgi:hypothetical protein
LNWRARSAIFATGLVLVDGCGGDAAPVERRIVAHSLVGCRVTGEPQMLVTALGDFGAERASDAVTARTSGELGIPQDFLGVELEVLPRTHTGIGYADPPAHVNVTLWPSGDGCDATGDVIPENRGGVATTAFGNGTGILAAGLDPVKRDQGFGAFALSLDLTTGKPSSSMRPGLPDARAFATTTPFGDGALVAGGLDSSDASDPTKPQAIDTAIVFSAGEFENLRIDLGNARAHHGATTLASGETLLVGGTSDGSSVLASMVAVSPVARNTRVLNVGTLRHPRKNPVVLRLADDRILVAGGTGQDGKAVSTLEWFARDGSACAPPVCPDVNSTLPPERRDVAFVALPAGGALAAGGFDPATPDDAAASDVWWITPEGTAERLEPLSPADRGTRRLRLVAASDGSPWAWNGSAWLRFDPWRAKFDHPREAPLDGPDDDMPDPVAVDPGLFVWLARTAPGNAGMNARVRGFRHGVRGRLAREAAPLLFADTAHVAPDRPPSAGVIEFDGQGLHLTRPNVTRVPRVVVTEALYGDFDLSGEAAPSGVLPEVEIGTMAVGSESCTWPSGGVGTSFSVRRRGVSVEVEVGQTRREVCPGPEGRVAIALRAPPFGDAVVRRLTIARQ